ncbi:MULTISPECIES: cobalamin biosynthesis protein CobW [Rhizobium/Agrobacterium group]|uniref:Cobalamin biosynthesis protein CobW n=2 Tax=Rhizobium/Agrobacterium group TaxID=227290 RepID=B9JXC3_ALLAM|nr:MULTISPECIES: cobalamin biosynthesis protein CobW [Rhizobium/Agrobacterium group]ACM36901.1 cobalamin biosynthesis protein CobW [Allorhizobium ampelinum S4]MCF1446388.1 cobalamin biosynthesis protein CobW [Allorhizobium ampelinum]MCF1492730.1 cobalamin biosynthesis protein CobW [Allorhizobium ampelinum]MUO31167.1 cobalamin biosynthesis protein CobW [Agrobacterium vitis]MUO44776.1 cobalamin biosynthesis protein CobW [Agrobacterium vitis]
MLQQKIPVTVITGFLGAGKTTIIRNMLMNAGGKKIALIINEFGDLGVDGEVLKGCGAETCTEDDIIELTNGCICCTVADDFVPTMQKLLARDVLPDHIVIETSGLALPQPLVAAFNWPDIRTRVTVDGVVTVVDSAAVAAGRFADDHDRIDAQRAADDSLDHESPIEELFEDQLTCADLIVLNKTDLLDADGLAKVRSDVTARMSRKPTLIEAKNGDVPVMVLLGIGAGSEADIDNRKSHHELEHEALHASGEDHDHHHDHDEFDSFVVDLPQVREPDRFVDGLKTVIEAHDVLRLKGFVDVPGKPMRLVVQAVGNRIDQYYDRPWASGEQRATRLVVIGLHDLDQSAIADAIRAAA